MNDMLPFGLYIHWPFCPSKCPYCDFNSHVRDSVDEKRWEKALLCELVHAAQSVENRTLKTIFFGGGTPSLMNPSTIQALIRKALDLFPSHPSLEITLEANPGTLTREKCEDFRKAGVNRLSVGVQSFDPEALTFLGRRHSVMQAIEALEMGAELFPRFSFDLIYARKDQTGKQWEAELRQALIYARGHLSLYQLTIEPQTVFATRVGRGEELTLPPDPAAGLYEKTESLMREAGMESYEVSNYAIPGHECQHNLLYWNVEDYVGIGPGAHGRLTQGQEKHATYRLRAPEVWLEAVEKKGHGLDSSLVLSPSERLFEVTLMGLRLNQGLSLKRLFEETGYEAEQIYPGLHILLTEGLLKKTQTHLIASFEGRLRLNSLTAYLLGR